MRGQQDLVQLISETTPVGIITLDVEGQMVSANSVAEELLGLTRDEITGRTYNDPKWRITDGNGGTFPDEQLPFRRVVATGETVRDVRFGVQWPDGRRVYLSVNAAPIVDEAGRITAVLTVFDDITERVASQRALEASEARYRSLFNSMQDAFSLQEIIYGHPGGPVDRPHRQGGAAGHRGSLDHVVRRGGAHGEAHPRRTVRAGVRSLLRSVGVSPGAEPVCGPFHRRDRAQARRGVDAPALAPRCDCDAGRRRGRRRCASSRAPFPRASASSGTAPLRCGVSGLTLRRWFKCS